MRGGIDPHCPGDDPTRRSVPEILACPFCGGEVEIWTDEEVGRCAGCTTKIARRELTRSWGELAAGLPRKGRPEA